MQRYSGTRIPVNGVAGWIQRTLRSADAHGRVHEAALVGLLHARRASLAHHGAVLRRQIGDARANVVLWLPSGCG